jgi:hypothetical protein
VTEITVLKTKNKSPKASSGDCAYRLAQVLSVETELQVDNQVAAPAVTRTPNLHRAKIRSSSSADVRGDSGDSEKEKSLSNEKNQNISENARSL